MAFGDKKRDAFRELPNYDGMYLRDAIGGTITDADLNTRQVQVKFPHDTRDTFDTTFDRDAFRESFGRRLPLMCWQHDLRDPIGHAIDAQITPKQNELIGQFSDFDAVPNARRAYSQIDDGTITDFSFGFRKPKWENHPKLRGVRNCRSATMLEFSPVSVGSIPGAVATGLREEDIEMAEQTLTATEIIAAVQAGLMDTEVGKRALAQLDGFAEIMPSPEQERIAALEAQLRDIAAAGGGREHITLNLGATDSNTAVTEPTADQMRARITELEAALAAPGTRAEYVVPDVITAEVVLGALPEPLQRTINESGAVLAVAPAGTEFFRSADEGDDGDDGAARAIAEQLVAAHRSIDEWLAGTERSDLPSDVQQALLLVDALGKSTGTLAEVLGTEGRAADSPYHQPANPAGSEGMGPTMVKCMECRGSGQAGDGKTCPECGGSGTVAVTRADGAMKDDDGDDDGDSMKDDDDEDDKKRAAASIDPENQTNMVDQIPQGAVKCTKCKGTGKLPNDADCPVCDGKGYMESAAAMAHRADPDSWSDTPWSQFSQSDYTPEQWKAATLIHQGDGMEKASHKLPIKEPSGKINRHAVAAAASRLNQVQGAGKDKAAHKLASLYDQMGEEPPEHVAELARAMYENPMHPEEPALAAKQALEARLNKMPRDVDSRKKQSKGMPDQITQTSDEGMPMPVNHAPVA